MYISASLYTIVKLSMKLTKLVNKVGNCVFIASVTFEALHFSPRAADSTHLVCAFFTGYKANRRRWLNWVHIGQKNCFHISQLENVRNPNNLQYLQWRSKTLFSSAEICFYVTAGSGSPLNLTAPPLSRAAKSQHMNFIITVTKSSANPFIP